MHTRDRIQLDVRINAKSHSGAQSVDTLQQLTLSGVKPGRHAEPLTLGDTWNRPRTRGKIEGATPDRAGAFKPIFSPHLDDFWSHI